MFGFGVPEFLILLVIIILLFGVGRISKIADETGRALRTFRENIAEKEDAEKDK